MNGSEATMENRNMLLDVLGKHGSRRMLSGVYGALQNWHNLQSVSDCISALQKRACS